MADAQGQDNSNSLYNNRIEDKYIIDKSDMDKVVNEIEDHLKPDYPDKSTDYTMISSTYLDSADLKFLRHDLTSEPIRYKMRVRSYGPNGQWDPDKFLEVKYREGDVRKKARIKIDLAAYTEVIGGNAVPIKTKKLNKDMSDSEYEAATSLIEECASGGVSPSVKVTYKRIAYQGKGVRTTIDVNLQVDDYAIAKQYDPDQLMKSGKWDELANIAKKYTSNRAVWEVKYSETRDDPQWIQDLTSKYMIGDIGFSKYLWALWTVLK